MSKAEKPLRAFVVQETDEGSGYVYFARHAIAAQRLGAMEICGETDLTYVTCKRAPWADACADTCIVPARLMIAHGWWFECYGCSENISEDWLEENHLPLSGVIGSQRSSVYCCGRCKWHAMKRKAKMEEQKQLALETYRSYIVERIPDAEFQEGPNFNHAYIDHQILGAYNWNTVVIQVRVPGFEHHVCLRVERVQRYRLQSTIGPVQPKFTISPNDVDEWDKRYGRKRHEQV